MINLQQKRGCFPGCHKGKSGTNFNIKRHPRSLFYLGAASIRALLVSLVCLFQVAGASPIWGQNGGQNGLQVASRGATQGAAPNSAEKNHAEMSELERLIEAMLKENPALKAEVKKSEAAEKRYKAETMFIENPMVSLSYQNIPLPDFPALDAHAMSSLTFSASQKAQLPAETLYRKKSAELMSIESRELTLDLTLRMVLHLRELYYEYYYHVETLQILKENHKALGDIITMARSLVAVNKMHSSQLLKLEADLTIMKNRILLSEAKARKAAEDLYQMTLLRLDPEASAKARGPLRDAQGSLAQALAQKGFQGDLLVSPNFDPYKHPLYKAAQNRAEAARAALAHERAALLPAITLGASYSLRSEVAGKDAGEDFVSFKISAPLPAYYPVKENRLIDARKKEWEAASEKLRQVELALQGGYGGEGEMVESLLEAYQNYESEAIPRYLASYRAHIASFSAGAVSLLDVLDSYRLYLNVELEKAALYRDLLKAMARLDYYRSWEPGPEEPNLEEPGESGGAAEINDIDTSDRELPDGENYEIQ